MFKAGVGSVMVAHLYIPAIDNRPNRATSISKNNVTGLLRNELGYQGLTFTDALNMQGVAKYFPGGEIAVESVIAGNDMLCLPADVPGSIQSIKDAITNNKLTWDDIYFSNKEDSSRILSTLALIKSRYKSVVIGVHGYNRYPANNFGISAAATSFAQQLQQQTKSITFVFGNPYAIKNFCDAKNLI